MSSVEDTARLANSPDKWAEYWKVEGRETWRKDALAGLYKRIAHLIPAGSTVSDLGGGIGILAEDLHNNHGCDVTVWEHAEETLGMLPSGIRPFLIDLEGDIPLINTSVVISTEVLEHLSKEARDRILEASKHKICFFTVPNHRLSPEEEPQHTVEYTAKSFLDELRSHFQYARVEVFGPYLLGVCGFIKEFTMSVCFPARDEAADIELTLSSFRGVADQLIVGVDPRSKDKTREICEAYCDIVFDLASPEGVDEDKVPDGGVHFSWIRNQCINRCTGDWVFMTEGHEYLQYGHDSLLVLDKIMPKKAQVGFTLRRGQGQQWAFPWLFKNGLGYKYKRSTHNILDYPEGTYTVRLPQVVTLHARNHQNAIDRKSQRKVQNRKTLFEDWTVNKNTNSLYYLGSEWREYDNQRSIKYLEEFVETSNNGSMKYQARLILAKTLWIEGDKKSAKKVLYKCTEDDWNRIDHWIWLGDLAFDDGQFEEAIQFYRYSSVMMGQAPFTLWWIDLCNYSYLPAQRLAQTYGELSMYNESLYWARQVLDHLPEDAPPEFADEARNNIKILEDAIAQSGTVHQENYLNG